MMIERKILEALDACRPASDDLHAPDHPELAEAAALVQTDASVQEAFARVQHFDLEIRSAMEVVELPAGLAGRVKARLTAAAPVETPPAADPVSLPVPVQAAGVDISRRNWWPAAFAAMAAAVAVVFGTWQFWPEGEVELTRDKFRSLSRDWHSLAQDSAAWQTDVASAPADRPFPEDALLARVKRFQVLSLPGDSQAVAYDVTYRNQRATVIVYQATAPELDLVPPRTPFNTQGICIGLWQRNGLLFALVIEGKPESYRQLLQSNQGTLG